MFECSYWILSARNPTVVIFNVKEFRNKQSICWFLEMIHGSVICGVFKNGWFWYRSVAHTIKSFSCGNPAFVLWSAKWLKLFNTVLKNTISMFIALFGALTPPGNCFLNQKFSIMLTQRRSSTPVVSYVITDNLSCFAKIEQTILYNLKCSSHHRVIWKLWQWDPYTLLTIS